MRCFFRHKQVSKIQHNIEVGINLFSEVLQTSICQVTGAAIINGAVLLSL